MQETKELLDARVQLEQLDPLESQPILEQPEQLDALD
jgi:hypothetical protein